MPSFGGGFTNKRSIVDLTADERANLLALLGKGMALARKPAGARILPLTDEDMADEEIAAALHVHRVTVEQTRRRFVEGGIEQALNEQPRQLIAEVRLPVPAAPGRPQRIDYEYRRQGTANLFLCVVNWHPIGGSSKFCMHRHGLTDLSLESIEAICRGDVFSVRAAPYGCGSKQTRSLD